MIRFNAPTAALGLAIAAAASSIAIACAGGDDTIGWTPEASNALLSPSNDTRANLILLMADRYGTRVADPRTMATGIVPFGMTYQQFESRLHPPQPNGLPDYGGDSDAGATLCHSNAQGTAQFGAAVAADPSVPAAERDRLVAARAQLSAACEKADEARLTLTSISSPSGQSYARYLEASRLFYAGRFPAAAAAFAETGRSAPNWVADTSAYMRLRALLAQAVASSVDEWGSVAEPAKRDQASISAANAARSSYLAAFSNGRYVRSARDFDRRIAWLSGNASALGGSYSRLVAAPLVRGNLPDIAVVDEVDRKLLPSKDGAGVTDPALLAVIDLMRLRSLEGDTERSCCGPLLTRAELDRQKAVFARDPDLFSYLRATEAFTGRKQPREVLSLIPDASHQANFSYLQFSRQMLRGFALEALKDRNARGFWLSLLPGARQPYQSESVQLAILQHDRAAGIVGRLLETGSPVVHPLMRSAIIEKDAGIDLLRQTTSKGANGHERDAALFVLLANELHFGMYRDFLIDQRRLGPVQATEKASDAGWSIDSYSPDWKWPGAVPLGTFAPARPIGTTCPALRDTVISLAADAGAIHPLMCLAEYIRGEGFDTWNMEYDATTGATHSVPHPGFTGTPITRAAIYQRVMTAPAATADEKAFALNRAIRCYQPSGISDCGGADVPKATRKAWYNQLKSQYPASRWAKELKYYW